ncbi:hypothetical protein ALP71_01649 [Pseudomonas coronafaciens pv. garcae]|nr:hypothetical protein ALP71_01649 [Pseudomonas coronafaciens pv. garcae]
MGTRQFPGQFGIPVDLVRVNFTAQIGDQFGTVVQQPGVFVIGQTRAQDGKQLGKVYCIFGGIADLRLRQRALQPVRAGFALGQVDVEHLLHQSRIAHGKTEVQVSSCQLSIEQRNRQAASQAQQDFEVFAARMNDFDHVGIFKQRRQGPPVIDQQRINQPRAFSVAYLQQRGYRVKRIDPHELGVERDKRQRLPLCAIQGEAVVVANPVNIDGHMALPSTMARSIYRHRRISRVCRPSLAVLHAND